MINLRWTITASIGSKSLKIQPRQFGISFVIYKLSNNWGLNGKFKIDVRKRWTQLGKKTISFMPHPSLDTKILTGQGIRKLNHEKRVKLIRQV